MNHGRFGDVVWRSSIIQNNMLADDLGYLGITQPRKE
jgi:hypothetical protein